MGGKVVVGKGGGGGKFSFFRDPRAFDEGKI